MKQITLLATALFICVLPLLSCGNDDDGKRETYPLSFEKEYYENV